MITEQRYLNAIRLIRLYREQVNKTVELELNEDLDLIDLRLFLSVRTINALKFNDVTKLSDLKDKRLRDFSKYRNLGKKSINEIKEICNKYNVDIKK